MNEHVLITVLATMTCNMYKGLDNLRADGESYVNPQYTDKRYHRFRENQSSPVSNGFMTPCPSRVHPISRRPSLMLSDSTTSCNAEPLSASSTSSFHSSPEYSSSSSSSGSTAASSRRQSAIYHDGHQYYSAESSPTPAFRPGRSKDSFSVEHYCLQEPIHTDPQLVYSNASSFDVTGEAIPHDNPNELLVPANNFVPSGQIEWQGAEDVLCGLPEFDLSEQNPASVCLGVDLVPNFGGNSVTQLDGCPQMDFEGHQAGPLRGLGAPQGPEPSHTASSLNPQTLGPPFDLCERSSDEYVSTSDDDGLLGSTGAGISNALRKYAKAYRPPERRSTRDSSSSKTGCSSRQNKCDHCTYACNRPEHLTRHVNAKHNPDPKRFMCKFPDCIDKKSGERRIIVGRNDNYKAHYTKTHFSYGNTEKSGKNIRQSMKASIEKGLRDVDFRWNMMLEGKMSMDPSTKSIWKMIGYSIRETREIKVKDIKPEWQGPDDTTLEEFDARWNALKNRTLDYEQAMSVGTDMPESEEQGLLGVSMAESEEMGIKHLDVRWKLLLEGKMSVKDSETLGMKEKNPAWIALQARRKS